MIFLFYSGVRTKQRGSGHGENISEYFASELVFKDTSNWRMVGTEHHPGTFWKKKVKCDDYGGHIKQTKWLNEMFVWNVVGMRMDVVPDHEKPWKPFMGKDLIIWAIKFCLAYLNIHALLSTLDFDSKTAIIEMDRDCEMRK